MAIDPAAARRVLMEMPSRKGGAVVRFAWRYLVTLIPLLLAGAWAWNDRGVASFVTVALVAGFTQNALGILMHEASHWFLAADRRVNDALANWLVCYPLANTVAGYRAEHFLHHRFSGSEGDPVRALYRGYRSRVDLLFGLLADLAGVTAARAFLSRYASPSRAEGRGFPDIVGMAIVQGGIAVAGWAVSGLWWAHAVLWLLPLATVPIAVNRVRTIAEHHVHCDSGEANRTTKPGFLEYLTIAPYGYSHHFEHHMLASIPYHQLQGAHQWILDAGEKPGERELNAGGYLAFFAASFTALPWRAPARLS
jgi:fatty acid desaturase